MADLFDGLTLPITISEMLTVAFDYLVLFGPWVALGIAVMFAPQIVSFLKSLLRRGGKNQG